MTPLAHRGYWRTKAEQNTLPAFRRAFDLGFGIETDIRDRAGELVIAHDPANDQAPSFYEFLELARRFTSPLALNVKADGLAPQLVSMVRAAAISRWFVFDMSIPETLRYRALGAPIFTRRSEYEPQAELERAAEGVWVDAFHNEWWGDDLLSSILDENRTAAIVSPELHGRAPEAIWTQLAAFHHPRRHELMICTDFPEQCAAAIGAKP